MGTVGTIRWSNIAQFGGTFDQFSILCLRGDYFYNSHVQCIFSTNCVNIALSVQNDHKKKWRTHTRVRARIYTFFIIIFGAIVMWTNYKYKIKIIFKQKIFMQENCVINNFYLIYIFLVKKSLILSFLNYLRKLMRYALQSKHSLLFICL